SSVELDVFGDAAHPAKDPAASAAATPPSPTNVRRVYVCFFLMASPSSAWPRQHCRDAARAVCWMGEPSRLRPSCGKTGRGASDEVCDFSREKTSYEAYDIVRSSL